MENTLVPWRNKCEENHDGINIPINRLNTCMYIYIDWIAVASWYFLLNCFGTCRFLHPIRTHPENTPHGFQARCVGRRSMTSIISQAKNQASRNSRGECLGISTPGGHLSKVHCEEDYSDVVTDALVVSFVAAPTEFLNNGSLVGFVGESFEKILEEEIEQFHLGWIHEIVGTLGRADIDLQLWHVLEDHTNKLWCLGPWLGEFCGFNKISLSAWFMIDVHLLINSVWRMNSNIPHPFLFFLSFWWVKKKKQQKLMLSKVLSPDSLRCFEVEHKGNCEPERNGCQRSVMKGAHSSTQIHWKHLNASS